MSSDANRQSWFRRMLTEQPAFAVSALYLFASVIGLSYSWAYLRPFGINVLQYSEISDFLLASLKEPLTWLLAVAAILLVQVDNVISRRVESRSPGRWLRWYGSDRYRQFNYPVSLLLIVGFLFGFAGVKYDSVRDGGGELVNVQLADGSSPQPRVLLGTTVNFIFVYDRDSGRSYVHPSENVLSISRAIPDSEPQPEPPAPQEQGSREVEPAESTPGG